jgi:hypothetical protein
VPGLQGEEEVREQRRKRRTNLGNMSPIEIQGNGSWAKDRIRHGARRRYNLGHGAGKKVLES